MRQMEPYQFEEYTAEIFRSEGWDSVQVTPRSNDGGKDIILHKGNTKALVECKRWRNKVSRPIVQKLHSAMITSNASKGYIVTPGGASGPAKEYARRVGITLITGENLANRARLAFTVK